ncbi:MAG: CDGSH iron-sulfur domain-containing protein [Nostoc sp.]
MASTTKITALDNGPFLVTGLVEVTDAKGKQFHSNQETLALCRCGGSTMKPFCDGTHSKLGFSAAERAVQQTSG